MISASAGAFARPSLLSQADNCPHLNHRPTIGSNWHIALAVLGEIWGCIRPRTGCPFHQLESCLLVGRGRGGGLPHCYLVSWSKWFVEIPSLSSLVSSSPPASLSLSPSFSLSLSRSVSLLLLLSHHWGITVCELLVRVFSHGPQPATDSLTVAVSGTFT